MVDPAITLHVLIDLHRALARETVLESQLERVARAAQAILEADHASIRVLDDSGTELVSGARVGAGVEHHPVTFGRGLGVAGWVVDHGEPVRIDDVSQDPRYVPVTGQGFEIRSMIAVPLMISGHVIGCLSATSARRAAFTPFHEDLAILLATVASSPIERSRLETIALRDPTTRAFGARYLGPRIAGEVNRARASGDPLAILALDLDELGDVRQSLGRATAEALLRVAVDRVLAVVRPRDVVIRRDGGEVVIVMPQTDLAEAERIADKISDALSLRVVELGPAFGDLELGASMGIVVWNGVESPTRLERRADEALRAARAKGPGTIAVWEGQEVDRLRKL